MKSPDFSLSEFTAREGENFQAFLHPQWADSLVDLGILKRKFFARHLDETRRGKSLALSLDGHKQGMLKIYRRGGLLGKFIHTLTMDSQRAQRELAIYHYLSQSSLPTPTPLAAVTWQTHRFFYRHLLLTEYWKEARDLVAYYLEKPHFFTEKKREIIDALARAVRNLHDHGIYHSDLNLTNFLILPTLKVGIIDFDKGKYYKSLPLSLRLKNILRLYRSSLKLHLKGKFPSLDEKDLWRFYYTYNLDYPPRKMAQAFEKYSFWIKVRKLFW